MEYTFLLNANIFIARLTEKVKPVGASGRLGPDFCPSPAQTDALHQPIDFDHAKRDRTHWPRQLQPREPAHFLWPNGPGKQKMYFLRLSLITKVPAAFLHTK